MHAPQADKQAAVLITIAWMLLAASHFYVWCTDDDWSYANALYFTFISVSTIGFGKTGVSGM